MSSFHLARVAAWLVALMIGAASSAAGQDAARGWSDEYDRSMRLWYDSSAAQWVEALPIGNGRIELLPALPDAWPDGEVTGLRARGSFDVDLRWAAGSLTEAVIHSHAGEPLRITSRVPVVVEGHEDPEIKTEAGRSYRVLPK